MNDATTKTARKGFAATAERIVRAETNFIESLKSLGGISHADAERVLAYYRKLRVVKRDAVVGTITVKHGAFLDRDVIRKAVAMA